MHVSPILSVLVTFCNQVHYIDDCLRSIITQQTNYPFEVLIAVDGKDDGSMEKLAFYAKRYNFIHYWKVQSDPRFLSLSRASHNRLFLLEKAKGRYLIVLDGDDFFCSSRRFEKGLRFLEEHKEFIGHACEWKKFDDRQKSFLPSSPRKLGTLDLKKYISQGIYIHIASCIFRNIFNDGENFEYNDFFDDTCLTHFLLKFGKIEYLDEQMFGYRIGIDSTFTSIKDHDKNILRFTTTIIKNKIIYGKFNNSIINYINNFYKLNPIISDNIKSSILFQKIPVVSDLLKIQSSDNLVERWYYKKSISDYMNQYDTEPVLSVLITFCGQRDYINDCLRSILKQKTTYAYEILIAVDGEDDGSMQLLSEYQKKYSFIHVWKVSSDERLLSFSRASQNRLFLLEKSRGKYFIVLDGDDFFCSTSHFDNSLHYLIENPSCIGFASSWMFYNNKNFYNKHIYKCSNYTNYSFMDTECYLHVSCCVFKNIKSNILKTFKDCYFFDDFIIMYFMSEYGYIHIDSNVDFVQRVGQKNSIYFSKTDYIKKLTSLIVWYKIYEITKLHLPAKKLSMFIKDILSMENECTPDVMKALNFQKINIAKDVVKINRNNFISNILKIKMIFYVKKI